MLEHGFLFWVFIIGLKDKWFANHIVSVWSSLYMFLVLDLLFGFPSETSVIQELVFFNLTLFSLNCHFVSSLSFFLNRDFGGAMSQPYLWLCHIQQYSLQFYINWRHWLLVLPNQVRRNVICSYSQFIWYMLIYEYDTYIILFPCVG